MSVNTDLGAGRAFLRSLYQQYADWGVDFSKFSEFHKIREKNYNQYRITVHTHITELNE